MKQMLIFLLLTLATTTTIFAQEESSSVSENVGKRWGSYVSYFAMLQFKEETVPNRTGDVSGVTRSPISLAITNTYSLTKNGQFISSAYWSYYLKTSIDLSATGTSQKIDYPSEYGINLHYRQKIPNFSAWYFFGGADYESLSFFKTEEYIQGKPLAFGRYNLIFGTLGLSRTFLAEGRIINIKGGFSQTISSSSDVGGVKMKGQKFHLMASYRPDSESRFFYNIFVNRYELKNYSENSLTRVGVGVNFLLR